MRYFIAFFIFLVIAAFSIAGFRGSNSSKPPLEVFPDMDRQFKYKPQAESAFFTDGRADRPPVPGTVSLGSFHENDYFVTGKADGEFGRGFPISVDFDTMKHGREKFTIFCAVCHGASGDGNGITKKYGMVATPSFHNDRFRNMPEGEIFNTITNGKNNMGPYGAKLRPSERWAVIAYVRALQRAQNSRISDVPAENMGDLGL